MIWFPCKKCGKRHKQPAEAAGSLIFCECGQANRVPWESTVPEPPAQTEGEANRPASRRTRWSDSGAEDDTEPERRRRRPTRPRDPNHCLNHPEAAASDTCPDCGEAFCPRCLVEFQGVRLCGACKNYRVRQLQRLPRIAGLAIGALVAGLASAPLVFCITLSAIGSRQPGTIFVCGVIGMLLGAAALALGLVALRQTEKKARLGGRGMALTGAAFGIAGFLWSLTLVVMMASRLGEG